MKKQFTLGFALLLCTCSSLLFGQSFDDSLRIMTYNVLNFGDACQGQPSSQYQNLRTIIGFTNPDVVGMVKLQSIKSSPTDIHGVSGYGFADTIVAETFNKVYPNRYAHSGFTDAALSGNTTVLFYDQNKLGYLGLTTLVVSTEDFNLFKLYVKDPYLSTTLDTTFVYFVLNHTISGNTSNGRDQQDTLVANALRKKFYHLPNLINMGDYNLRLSGEIGYQAYDNPKDSGFRVSEGPFFPDKKLTYPLDWDTSPTLCSGFLSTSTRQSPSLPNSCGTSGGAKDWYDHILVSPWIANNLNYLSYIPHSYHTVGNDGKRIGISVNDTVTNGKNNSAPGSVLNALWHFSNKYPVMCTIGLTYNRTGKSLPDPNLVAGIDGIRNANLNIEISSLVISQYKISFGEDLMQKKILLVWTDLLGRQVATEQITIESNQMIRPMPIAQKGIYLLSGYIGSKRKNFRVVVD